VAVAALLDSITLPTIDPFRVIQVVLPIVGIGLLIAIFYEVSVRPRLRGRMASNTELPAAPEPALPASSPATPDPRVLSPTNSTSNLRFEDPRASQLTGPAKPDRTIEVNLLPMPLHLPHDGGDRHFRLTRNHSNGSVELRVLAAYNLSNLSAWPVRVRTVRIELIDPELPNTSPFFKVYVPISSTVSPLDGVELLVHAPPYSDKLDISVRATSPGRLPPTHLFLVLDISSIGVDREERTLLTRFGRC